MEIKKGKGKTNYGAGIEISLSTDEVAMAIYQYLRGNYDVQINGASTILVNNVQLSQYKTHIYVDPSGEVKWGDKLYNGRTGEEVQEEGEAVYYQGDRFLFREGVGTLKLYISEDNDAIILTDNNGKVIKKIESF